MNYEMKWNGKRVVLDELSSGAVYKQLKEWGYSDEDVVEALNVTWFDHELLEYKLRNDNGEVIWHFPDRTTFTICAIPTIIHLYSKKLKH